MVHHLVELRGELGVKCGNRLVDRPRQVAVEGDGARKRLFNQRLDEFLRPIGLGLLGCRDDLFEKTAGSGGFGNSRRRRRRDIGIGNGSALLLVEPQLTR